MYVDDLKKQVDELQKKIKELSMQNQILELREEAATKYGSSGIKLIDGNLYGCLYENYQFYDIKISDMLGRPLENGDVLLLGDWDRPLEIRGSELYDPYFDSAYAAYHVGTIKNYRLHLHPIYKLQDKDAEHEIGDLVVYIYDNDISYGIQYSEKEIFTRNGTIIEKDCYSVKNPTPEEIKIKKELIEKSQKLIQTQLEYTGMRNGEAFIQDERYLYILIEQRSRVRYLYQKLDLKRNPEVLDELKNGKLTLNDIENRRKYNSEKVIDKKFDRKSFIGYYEMEGLNCEKENSEEHTR